MLNIGQQVNDIQQSTDKPDLLTAIATGLSEMPVVALLGARRGGKTTLTRQAMSTWSGPSAAFDLEVAADRQALGAVPERLLRDGAGSVVVDEVQRIPELFEVLRPISDDPNLMAVFLLLGGASLDFGQGYLRDAGGKDPIH